jgi:hypothetical protein
MGETQMPDTNLLRDVVMLTEFSKLAIMTELVKRAPGNLGRTGLMKCLFFLQTLRNVPLPYTFRLYTYGPFDSHVLEDLQYAESLGAIRSTVVAYPGGYGYQLHPGPKAARVEERASEFVAQHQDSITWVLQEFGNRTALDLEMASTLIYVDRTFVEKGSKIQITDLAKRVHDVKPHLTTDTIEKEARNLNQRGLLQAVA